MAATTQAALHSHVHETEQPDTHEHATLVDPLTKAVAMLVGPGGLADKIGLRDHVKVNVLGDGKIIQTGGTT